MAEIVIYTTKTCDMCSAAKDFLQRKGIAFQEKDIYETPCALEEWERVNGHSAMLPLIRVGRRYVSGFNPMALCSLIQGGS